MTPPEAIETKSTSVAFRLYSKGAVKVYCRSFLTPRFLFFASSLFFILSIGPIPDLLCPAVASSETEQPPADLPEVDTYDQLIAAIRSAREASNHRLHEAAQREKIRESWEIGSLIQKHVMLNGGRADYAKQVVERIAGDLGLSRTELYYMIEFASAYPIVPTSGQLTWAAYRELLSINDSEKRNVLAKQAAAEGWDVQRVRSEVRKEKSGDLTADQRKLNAVQGKLNVFRVIREKTGPEPGELLLDLGFSNYYYPEKRLPFEEKTILELVSPGNPNARAKLRPLANGSDADLYTYHAFVADVIDGDTFTAVIRLGFGIRTFQRLRLRGIDAPEIETPEGVEAKKILESLLRSSEKKSSDENQSDRPNSAILNPPGAVILKTVRSDKYDRYLADVWVEGVYINQKLVDEGFAVVVES